jgi:hypothetical protein
MAWFSRFLNKETALRAIDVTRVNSALSIHPILLAAGGEWEPESRTTRGLSSTDDADWAVQRPE